MQTRIGASFFAPGHLEHMRGDILPVTISKIKKMIPRKHLKQAHNTCMTGSQNVRSANHDLETNRNSRVRKNIFSNVWLGVSCYQAQ
jgi:hypothetical protein